MATGIQGEDLTHYSCGECGALCINPDDAETTDAGLCEDCLNGETGAFGGASGSKYHLRPGGEMEPWRYACPSCGGYRVEEYGERWECQDCGKPSTLDELVDRKRDDEADADDGQAEVREDDEAAEEVTPERTTADAPAVPPAVRALRFDVDDDGEPVPAAVADNLTDLIDAHEAIDWPEVPGVSVYEAAAWTARLIEAEAKAEARGVEP